MNSGPTSSEGLRGRDLRDPFKPVPFHYSTILMVHWKGEQAVLSQKKSFLALKTIKQRGKKYSVASARKKSLKNMQAKSGTQVPVWEICTYCFK